jgi:hypothetical protein
MRAIRLMIKEIIIIIRPNRDDNNHALIIAIDVDSQTDERSGRAFALIPRKIMKRWICICQIAGL